jgi:two-component system nitrate/nitrite response regulator NarL
MEATRRISVVIADDTEDMRVLVSTALELDGRFEVVDEVSDGRAAIEACARLRPDAIVLDLTMPVISGDRALPLIVSTAPETAVIVYSAYWSAHTERELFAAGAAAVLSKIVRPIDLADLVADAVARHRVD